MARSHRQPRRSEEQHVTRRQAWPLLVALLSRKWPGTGFTGKIGLGVARCKLSAERELDPFLAYPVVSTYPNLRASSSNEVLTRAKAKRSS